MDTQGQKNADWGFQAPADGWYLMEFQGDIKETKKEVDGETKISLQLPLKGISDLAGEDVAFQMSIFIPLSGETDKEIGFAKKKMADVLVNAGLWEKFEKQYPGNDVSILDKRICEGLKMKLPDQRVMAKIETKESKKDKKTYTNIIGLAPRDFKPEASTSKAPKTTKAPKEASEAKSEGW